ncbi:hypothetical protein D3C86_2117500 [compost metagenome]
MGRFGGIAGSMIGGTLLSLGLSMNLIFAVLGVPAILAAIALASGPKPATTRAALSMEH